MKYGETVFDASYLLFAIVMGIRILIRRRDLVGKRMGIAVLILGCGDAFHLIPRMLNYFIDADFTAWLGFGKLVTSVTMTLFYLQLYRLWLEVYEEEEDRVLSIVVWLFWRRRKDVRCFRHVWLLITLSFLSYIPVAVGAGFFPVLGMLMLPKTVCYMLLIMSFWKYASARE